MLDLESETSTGDATSRGAVSATAAIAAGVGALVLAVVFYWIFGFPANIPLAFGAAVLLAEIVELIIRGEDLRLRNAGRALVHAVAVAGACWLGVWIAALLGLT